MKATIDVTRIELPFLIDALALYLVEGPLNSRRSAYAITLLKRLETMKQREFPDRPYTSGRYDHHQRITLLEESNPKRGDSRNRFGLYRDGMSIEAALAAGIRAADLRWDHAHGFIDIV